jgi:hypothetical protein
MAQIEPNRLWDISGSMQYATRGYVLSKVASFCEYFAIVFISTQNYGLPKGSNMLNKINYCIRRAIFYERASNFSTDRLQTREKGLIWNASTLLRTFKSNSSASFNEQRSHNFVNGNGVQIALFGCHFVCYNMGLMLHHLSAALF